MEMLIPWMQRPQTPGWPQEACACKVLRGPGPSPLGSGEGKEAGDLEGLLRAGHRLFPSSHAVQDWEEEPAVWDTAEAIPVHRLTNSHPLSRRSDCPGSAIPTQGLNTRLVGLQARLAHFLPGPTCLCGALSSGVTERAVPSVGAWGSGVGCP